MSRRTGVGPDGQTHYVDVDDGLLNPPASAHFETPQLGQTSAVATSIVEAGAWWPAKPQDLGEPAIEALRDMVEQWIGEGFDVPPYKPEQYDVFEWLGITGEVRSGYDTTRPRVTRAAADTMNECLG